MYYSVCVGPVRARWRWSQPQPAWGRVGGRCSSAFGRPPAPRQDFSSERSLLGPVTHYWDSPYQNSLSVYRANHWPICAWLIPFSFNTCFNLHIAIDKTTKQAEYFSVSTTRGTTVWTWPLRPRSGSRTMCLFNLMTTQPIQVKGSQRAPGAECVGEGRDFLVRRAQNTSRPTYWYHLVITLNGFVMQF